MATIRKHPRANSWQVMYRDPLGKQRSKNFEKKTAAKRFAAAVETDKRRGEYIDPWRSPKYLLGESYGAMRSAGVVHHLQSRHRMGFNGVILVSPFLDAHRPDLLRAVPVARKNRRLERGQE